MTYEWDPGKAAENIKKHRVSFEEGSPVFLDPSAFAFWDPDHSEEEERGHDRSFSAEPDPVCRTRDAERRHPNDQCAASHETEAKTV